MKFADMQAKGLLTGKPIEPKKPYKPEHAHAPVEAKPPTFRLFRLTKPMHDGCTHAGEVWIKGSMWTITAKVVETDHGRQFHGHVEAPGEAIRKKPTQSTPKDDLVALAEGTPFDDPLPKAPF